MKLYSCLLSMISLGSLFSSILITLCSSTPTFSVTKTTTTPILNSAGCLRHDRIWFSGFQQPSPLDLNLSVSSVDNCDPMGTFSIKSNRMDNIETFTCECKMGFTAKRCDFKLANDIGTDRPSTFEDASWVLANSPIIGLIQHNGNTRLRFRWGYVDDETPNQWSFFETRPRVKQSNVIFSFTDAITSVLNGGSTYATGSPDQDFILSSNDHYLWLQTPPANELKQNITCVTLMGYEVDDDNINHNYMNWDTMIPSPLVQFTVVRDPYRSDTPIPGDPGTCIAPHRWNIISDQSPQLNNCFCDEMTKTFGSNCQYQYQFNQLAQFSITLYNYLTKIDSVVDIPQSTIYNEHIVDITVPNHDTVIIGFKVWSLGSDYSPLISSQLIPLTSADRVDNVYTLRFTLSVLPGVINPPLEQSTNGIGYNIQVVNEDGNEDFLPLGAYSLLKSTCTTTPPAGCNPDGTLGTCSDEQTTCECLDGWFGKTCWTTLEFYRNNYFQSFDPAYSPVFHLGESFLVAAINTKPGGDETFNPEVMSVQFRNDLSLPTVTSTQLYPDSTSFLARITIPSATNYLLRGENLRVNSSSKNKGSIKVVYGTDPDDYIIVNNIVTLNSKCSSYADGLSPYPNSIVDLLPQQGILGCSQSDLFCRQGWFGPRCQHNFVTFTHSNSQYPSTMPFIEQQSLKWATIGTNSVQFRWDIDQITGFHDNVMFSKDMYSYSPRFTQSTPSFPLPSLSTFQPTYIFITLRAVSTTYSSKQPVITVGPFKRFRCEDGATLPNGLRLLEGSPCIEKNTIGCEVLTDFNPGIILTKSCKCKSGYTGPQCQTHYRHDLTSAPSSSLFIENEAGYPPATVVFVNHSEDPIQDTQQAPFQYFALNSLISQSVTVPSTQWTRRVSVGYGAVENTLQTRFYLPESDQDEYPALEIAMITTLESPPIPYCYDGSLKQPSLSSTSVCDCTTGKHFGPNCSLYLDVYKELSGLGSRKIKNRLGDDNNPFFSHDILHVELGSAIPQPFDVSLNTNPVLIMGATKIGSDGLEQKRYFGILDTLGGKLEAQIDHVYGSYSTWNLFSLMKAAPRRQLVNFSPVSNDCMDVSAKFGRDCSGNTYCNPKATTFEAACPCLNGYYSKTIDPSPCLHGIQFPEVYYGFDTFIALVSNSKFTFNALGSSNTQFDAIFTPELQDAEVVQMPVTATTNTLEFSFVLPTVAEQNGPNNLNSISGTITISGLYTNNAMENVSVQVQTFQVRIYHAVSDFRSYINTAINLLSSGSSFGQILGQPQLDYLCHPDNTISSTFIYPLTPVCICKGGWAGTFCDIKVETKFGIANRNVIISITFGHTAAPYHNSIPFIPRIAAVNPSTQLITYYDIIPTEMTVEADVKYDVYIPVTHGTFNYFEISLTTTSPTKSPSDPLIVAVPIEPARQCNVLSSSCSPYTTDKCEKVPNENNTHLCWCKTGYLGPKCANSVTPSYSPDTSLFKPFLLQVLKSTLSSTFYVGQPVIYNLNLPSSLRNSPEFESFFLFDKTTLNLSTPTPLVTITAPQTNGKLRFPINHKGLVYQNTRIISSEMGYLDFDQGSRATVETSCQWFQRNFNQQHGTSSTARPCNEKGATNCNLEATDANFICECNKSSFDPLTNIMSFTFGSYCEFLLKIPLGPYYIGQRITMSIITYYPTRFQPFQSNGLYSIELHSVNASSTPIALTPTLVEGRGVAGPGNDWTQTYHLEIPDTLVDTKTQSSLLTSTQINDLTHFKWVVKRSSNEVFDFGSTVVENNKFRIVEPCYWTQLVNYPTKCSEQTDIQGNYVAVSSCINPDTHAIECQCNDGYYFNECRFKFDLKTPPVELTSQSSTFSYYLQQPLHLTAQWYTTPLDFAMKRRPYDMTLTSSDGSIVRLDPDDSLFDWDKREWKLTASPHLGSSTTMSIQGAPYSSTKPMGFTISVPKNSDISQTEQSFLLHSSYFNLDGVNQPLMNTVDGIKEYYGITCPGTTPDTATLLTTPHGCRCLQMDVFGPHCGFKMDITASKNNTRPSLNYIWHPYQIYTYNISNIIPLVELPEESPHNTLPTHYHFEVALGSVNTVNHNYLFLTRLVLEPGPEPNTFMIPSTDNQPLTFGDMYLVSDDITDQVNGGREYWVRALLISPNGCPSDRSLGPIPDSTSSTRKCKCVSGYYGDKCEYHITIPDYKIQIDSPGGNSQRPIVVRIPTSKIQLPESYQLHDARIFAIPNLLSSTIPVNHTFVVDRIQQEMVLNDKLLDFTGYLTQYQLVLRFSPSSSTSSSFELQADESNIIEHIISEPLTLSAEPCSLSTLGASLDCTPTIDIPTVIDFQLQLTTSIPSHIDSALSTITYPGTPTMVTIPVYRDLTGKALIQMWSYVQGADGVFETNPIVISAITSTISPLSSTPHIFSYTIPYSLVAAKLFYTITFPSPQGTTERTKVISPLFSAIAKCYTEPTNTSLHNIASNWETTCGWNGRCSNLTQQCKCNSGWTGALCLEKFTPCSQCQQDNMSQCNEITDTCTCKSGWNGNTCQLSTECQKSSEKKCSGDNGYLAPSTQADKCGNTCICNNNWSGLKCHSCELQCANGGKPYNKCDRCGCPEGFLPPFCHCQGVHGDITINGYNNALNRHYQMMQTVTEESKLSSLYIDLEVLSLTLQESVNHLLAEFMQLTETTVITQLQPTNNYKGTKISLAIKFGCHDYNPDIDKTKLYANWSDMLVTITTDEAFLSLFTFPQSIVVDSTDLKPEQSSLPTGSDMLNNSYTVTINFSLATLFIAVAFIF